MLKSSSAFKRIAHRGASGEAPENTLPALTLAIEKYRVDLVEMDVRVSSDGVPVVLHDETLERTTNGTGKVRERTLQELKSYDAGFHFDPGLKGEFLSRGKGVTIPTLEEVLNQFSSMPFLIEIKDRDARSAKKVIEVVQRSPKREGTIVASFHHSVTQEIRKRRHHAIRSLFSEREVFFTYLRFLAGLRDFTPPAHRMSLPVSRHRLRLDERNWIHFLHRLGVRIYYWTVDDPEEMKRLMELGADGIMTNYPQRLNQIMGL